MDEGELVRRFALNLGKFTDVAIRAGFGLARRLPLIGPAMARYEAGYIQWGARRWLLTSYQDARFELDWGVTMEVCRKHIYFCENNPLVGRIENLAIQFAVGWNGLKVIPNATDPDMERDDLQAHNSAKALRWEKFGVRPDLSNNFNLSQLTVLWERNLFRTGNIIVLKVLDEKGNKKVQTIDRLRLMTPPQFQAEEGKTVIQGIRLKVIKVPIVEIARDGRRVKQIKDVITGRPDVFYIRDEFELDKFAEVPADQVIHKFDPLAPGQMIGIPRGHRAINLLHDFEDLHILEMGAAKLAARIGTVHTNPAGEFAVDKNRAVQLKIGSVNAAGSTINKNALFDYKIEVGDQEIAMRSGDTLENFMVKRPTVAQQDYWDFMLSQICMGYNAPKLLVLPYSLQGTVTRADLDVCSQGFGLADFELVSSVVREIYEWWSDGDIKFDRSLLNEKIPAQPHDCVIRPPRAPNVDVGYTAQALAAELEMGKKSLQDVLAEDNKDWRQHLTRIAETEAFLNQLGKKYNLPPERIAFKMFNSLKYSVRTDEDPYQNEFGPPPAANPNQKPSIAAPAAPAANE
jgi:hypothetical protein